MHLVPATRRIWDGIVQHISWKASFGAAASAGANGSAVPEPSAFILLLVGVAGVTRACVRSARYEK